MKKILSVLIAAAMLLSLASLLGGCSGESDYPVKIGGITFTEEPQEIVILNKNLADIISCVGYDIKMVGRSDEVSQQGLQVVPSVGSSSEPDVGKIKELGADVVFADDTIDDAAVESLTAEGIPVVKTEDANTQKQLKNVYKKLGTILGGNITGKKQGAQAYKSLTTTLRDVKSAVDSKNIVTTVVYLYIDNGVLKTFNSNTWGATMLSYTGAVNVAQNFESNVVNAEDLKLSKPDFIFCADEHVESYLNNHAELSSLSALSERTFTVPLEDISMQGNSSLDVLENMLRDMYPEDFSD
ncbi:MAG: ABC transporter substrate-binding protein [Ruminococcus sp.]|nr:ABC transporter substrate-binding protein [Ruminococcus sp.]